MFIKNNEFERFLKKTDTQAQAAASINCKQSLVSAIRSQNREVSKGMAKSIIEAYPELSLYKLLYPES